MQVPMSVIWLHVSGSCGFPERDLAHTQPEIASFTKSIFMFVLIFREIKTCQSKAITKVGGMTRAREDL